MHRDAVELTSWLNTCLEQPVVSLELLNGGKNNRAYKVVTAQQICFLKQFYGDSNERFEREVAFLRNLHSANIPALPKLIASDSELGLSLTSFIHGRPLTQVTIDSVVQAAQFINDINSAVQQDMSGFCLAKGALLNVEAFIDDIQNRLQSLSEENQSPALANSLEDFITRELTPTYEVYVDNVKAQLDIESPFELVLSPSDFGFHNALMNKNVHFFDFEYAGLDSLEKLTTDFFAQPRYAIPQDLLSRFVATTSLVKNTEEFCHRCRTLLPLAHIKWILIFLNDFKHPDKLRREFAGNSKQCDQHLNEQLKKAKNRLRFINYKEGEVL